MATDVHLSVAAALEQAGLEPRAVVDLVSNAGSTYRLSVESLSWSGLSYEARLETTPIVTIQPSSPERGVFGGASIQLDIADPDGRFGSIRPGAFEGASCTIRYVLADVPSYAVRDFAMTVTDVAKPDPSIFRLVAEDILSPQLRTEWPPNAWVVTRSMNGLGPTVPLNQPAVGPGKTYPLIIGRVLVPCVIRLDAYATDAGSYYTHHFVDMGLWTSGTGGDLLQEFNGSFSRLSYRNTVNAGQWVNSANPPVRQVNATNIGGPLTDYSGAYLPLASRQAGSDPSSYNGTQRFAWTHAELAQWMLSNTPVGPLLAVHSASFSSAHSFYCTTINTVNLTYSGSGAHAFHDARGYIAEQRPYAEWLGAALHDGMAGLRHRSRLHFVCLAQSRAPVCSFHAGNIIRGSLSWDDTPLPQLETKRTISYRRQTKSTEPNATQTYEASSIGLSVTREAPFIGHAIAAQRCAQFWAKREWFGRRTYTWRTSLTFFPLEQHDLVRLHMPTMSASGQLCEIERVQLQPDYSVEIQARETHTDIFTMVNTPTLDLVEYLFYQRLPFDASSYLLNSGGGAFGVYHTMELTPTRAQAIYYQPNAQVWFPSSLFSANDSACIIFIGNSSFTPTANIPNFERWLQAFELARDE